MSMNNGSAGRAWRIPPPPAPHMPSPDANSYCFMCGHWHYGMVLVHCTRCKSLIYRVIPTDDLHCFHSRSSLEGF